MTLVRTRLACLAALYLLGAALAAPASAESFASSASSAGSASSGSASDSIKGSSNSSTQDNKVAEGDYRIDAIETAGARPGFVQLHLQHVAQRGTTIVLELPQPTAQRAALAVGTQVAARQRAYGIEFAQADAAFFLVLSDAWFRELPSNPVL